MKTVKKIKQQQIFSKSILSNISGSVTSSVTLYFGVLIVALILSSPRAQSGDRKSGCNEHMVITCELTVSQLAPE